MLLPVIALLLEGFAFEIRGFHSDSGSEYVNHDVAQLLNKLHVEFTKSRPRQTNDNALVESKNGAVIRKLMGYSHIPQKHATTINRFYTEALNPYLNFHRPCYFAVDTIDAKGKVRKTYPHEQIMTPWEKLQSIRRLGGPAQARAHVRVSRTPGPHTERHRGREARPERWKDAVSILPAQAGVMARTARIDQG
jgi:transposase InsO family protein